jgi:hypothetical protein
VRPTQQLLSSTAPFFASGAMIPTQMMIQGTLNSPIISPIMGTNSVAWNQYLLASQAANLGLYSPNISHPAFVLPIQVNSPTPRIFSPASYLSASQDSSFTVLSQMTSDSSNDSPNFEQEWSPSNGRKKRKMSSNILSPPPEKRSK